MASRVTIRPRFNRLNGPGRRPCEAGRPHRPRLGDHGSIDGSTIVGHSDRIGLKDTRHMTSWNSSHGSRGCSPDGLKSSGGAGLFYCFVAN